MIIYTYIYLQIFQHVGISDPEWLSWRYGCNKSVETLDMECLCMTGRAIEQKGLTGIWMAYGTRRNLRHFIIWVSEKMPPKSRGFRSFPGYNCQSHQGATGPYGRVGLVDPGCPKIPCLLSCSSFSQYKIRTANS